MVGVSSILNQLTHELGDPGTWKDIDVLIYPKAVRYDIRLHGRR